MDTCSYFIEDKALFGGYPDNVKFEELKRCGVIYFVDLITTSERDKLTEVYDTEGIKYLNYEIKDRYVPEDIYNYIKFIHNISCIIEELDDGQKLYIHCKGGHGRSGVVVSCILCYLCKYTSEKSLELTNTYHNNRKVMKDKWRDYLGANYRLFQNDSLIPALKYALMLPSSILFTISGRTQYFTLSPISGFRTIIVTSPPLR